MMMSAREVALKIIYQVNEEDAFSNLVLDNELKRSGLDKRDRALVTQLSYGVIRRRNTLDWIINHFANRKVKKMTPWVRNALRLGLYQIRFLDKIPAPIACNETVEVAKEYCNRGAIKFVNGILRSIVRGLDEIKYPSLKRDPVQHIRYKYSYPQWLVERWIKEFGIEKTIEICINLNQIPPTVIRTNTLKATREELLENLNGQGVSAEEIREVKEAIDLISYSAIEKLDSFKRGEFQVQGLSSMLVGHIVEPNQDDLVIDLCSAPGGKATHLAQLMKNRGQIYAVDIYEHKLGLIKDNCSRLGINNVTTFCKAGQEIEFDNKADKILVDAPCSGLGIIAKKPEIKWQKKPQDLVQLQELQLSLLANATKLVKRGGEIIYSTCTFTPEENREVINRFLDEFSGFEICDLNSKAELFGVKEYVADNYLQLLPDDRAFEGFFIAKLIKQN